MMVENIPGFILDTSQCVRVRVQANLFSHNFLCKKRIGVLITVGWFEGYRAKTKQSSAITRILTKHQGMFCIC
jgi:hypothetical protein